VIGNGARQEFSSSIPNLLNKTVQRALLACALGSLGVLTPLWSQVRDQAANERKLISRVEPHYPATLERLYIGGVVRLEVVVSPSGVVQSATLVGGSPILGQSAITAVKQWRYAPAATKTVCVVRLEFDPHR
jgi:TonB family protein